MNTYKICNEANFKLNFSQVFNNKKFFDKFLYNKLFKRDFILGLLGEGFGNEFTARIVSFFSYFSPSNLAVDLMKDFIMNLKLKIYCKNGVILSKEVNSSHNKIFLFLSEGAVLRDTRTLVKLNDPNFVPKKPGKKEKFDFINFLIEKDYILVHTTSQQLYKNYAILTGANDVLVYEFDLDRWLAPGYLSDHNLKLIEKKCLKISHFYPMGIQRRLRKEYPDVEFKKENFNAV
jgi:hypothetical protein